jgi:DNA invertase Pin-like site-specific DNA recombinase
MSHLIEKIGELASRGIGFRSLTENIDTTTPGGMLVFNIFGSLAQFERDLIRERTQAGLRAARARQQGRSPPCRHSRQAAQGPGAHRSRPYCAEAAARLKIGKTALYKALEGATAE